MDSAIVRSFTRNRHGTVITVGSAACWPASATALYFMAAPNWKTLCVTPLAAQLASSKRKLSYKKTKKVGGCPMNNTHALSLFSLFIFSHIFFVFIVISRTTGQRDKKKKKKDILLLPLDFSFFLWLLRVVLLLLVCLILITFDLWLLLLFVGYIISLSFYSLLYVFARCRFERKQNILGCVDE